MTALSLIATAMSMSSGSSFSMISVNIWTTPSISVPKIPSMKDCCAVRTSKTPTKTVSKTSSGIIILLVISISSRPLTISKILPRTPFCSSIPLIIVPSTSPIISAVRSWLATISPTISPVIWPIVPRRILTALPM